MACAIAYERARRCCTAWNEPIGRPNWTRSRTWREANSTAASAIAPVSAAMPTCQARRSASPLPGAERLAPSHPHTTHRVAGPRRDRLDVDVVGARQHGGIAVEHEVGVAQPGVPHQRGRRGDQADRGRQVAEPGQRADEHPGDDRRRRDGSGGAFRHQRRLDRAGIGEHVEEPLRRQPVEQGAVDAAVQFACPLVPGVVGEQAAQRVVEQFLLGGQFEVHHLPRGRSSDRRATRSSCTS